MNEGTTHNLIRIGIVSSVNEENGTIRALFDDKSNMVSDDLPILSFEYNLPKIGAQVLCLFLPNGLQQGFCLGEFYSDLNIPPVDDKNIYFKKFDDGTSIQYNKTSKELSISSPNPIIINGNIQVNGNISASGTVKASNIAG